jgi:bacterioferritin-associated ferredoxin
LGEISVTCGTCGTLLATTIENRQYFCAGCRETARFLIIDEVSEMLTEEAWQKLKARVKK